MALKSRKGFRGQEGLSGGKNRDWLNRRPKCWSSCSGMAFRQRKKAREAVQTAQEDDKTACIKKQKKGKKDHEQREHSELEQEQVMYECTDDH